MRPPANNLEDLQPPATALSAQLFAAERLGYVASAPARSVSIGQAGRAASAFAGACTTVFTRISLRVWGFFERLLIRRGWSRRFVPRCGALQLARRPLIPYFSRPSREQGMPFAAAPFAAAPFPRRTLLKVSTREIITYKTISSFVTRTLPLRWRGTGQGPASTPRQVVRAGATPVLSARLPFLAPAFALRLDPLRKIPSQAPPTSAPTGARRSEAGHLRSSIQSHTHIQSHTRSWRDRAPLIESLALSQPPIPQASRLGVSPSAPQPAARQPITVSIAAGPFPPPSPLPLMPALGTLPRPSFLTLPELVYGMHAFVAPPMPEALPISGGPAWQRSPTFVLPPSSVASAYAAPSSDIITSEDVAPRTSSFKSATRLLAVAAALTLVQSLSFLRPASAQSKPFVLGTAALAASFQGGGRPFGRLIGQHGPVHNSAGKDEARPLVSSPTPVLSRIGSALQRRSFNGLSLETLTFSRIIVSRTELLPPPLPQSVPHREGRRARRRTAASLPVFRPAALRAETGTPLTRFQVPESKRSQPALTPPDLPSLFAPAHRDRPVSVVVPLMRVAASVDLPREAGLPSEWPQVPARRELQAATPRSPLPWLNMEEGSPAQWGFPRWGFPRLSLLTRASRRRFTADDASRSNASRSGNLKSEALKSDDLIPDNARPARFAGVTDPEEERSFAPSGRRHAPSLFFRNLLTKPIFALPLSFLRHAQELSLVVPQLVVPQLVVPRLVVPRLVVPRLVVPRLKSPRELPLKTSPVAQSLRSVERAETDMPPQRLPVPSPLTARNPRSLLAAQPLVEAFMPASSDAARLVKEVMVAEFQPQLLSLVRSFLSDWWNAPLPGAAGRSEAGAAVHDSVATSLAPRLWDSEAVHPMPMTPTVARGRNSVALTTRLLSLEVAAPEGRLFSNCSRSAVPLRLQTLESLPTREAPALPPAARDSRGFVATIPSSVQSAGPLTDLRLLLTEAGRGRRIGFAGRDFAADRSARLPGLSPTLLLIPGATAVSLTRFPLHLLSLARSPVVMAAAEGTAALTVRRIVPARMVPAVVNAPAVAKTAALPSPPGPAMMLPSPAPPTSLEDAWAIQRVVSGSQGAGISATEASQQDTNLASQEKGAAANDVHLLANEVWSLLKRRLETEAERSGRR